MGEGIPYGDIIVIAAIAIFIVLRYKSVLGQKTGLDGSEQRPRPHMEGERVVQMKPQRATKEEAPEPVIDAAYEAIEDDGLSDGIIAIKKAEPNFTADGFLKGAKAAFEMVLEAYHNGDRATLKMLLSKPLYESFTKAMKDEGDDSTDGKVTLVAITRAELKEAELEKQVARITVGFLSEQIEAPSTQIDEVEDEWVFERDLRSKNPNWTIIDT